MTDEFIAKVRRHETTNAECRFYLDLVSHEVLNFNQAVLGYLEIVKNDPAICDDLKQYLLSAIAQIRNSSQILDDVKRMIRLKGVDPSRFELLDLRRIIDEAIEELKAQMRDRKLGITIEGVTDRVHVRGTDALRDVVVQMLTNLVRLDSSDEAFLCVSIERPASAPGMVDVVVENRKAGFPQQLRKPLGEELALDEKTNMVRYMGLLLVRAVAKRFGGGLTVSDKSQGNGMTSTRIILRLPEAMMR